MILLLPFVALLGLAIGSFLNVVVYRVPAGRSLTPDSACPKCGTAIRTSKKEPTMRGGAGRSRPAVTSR